MRQRLGIAAALLRRPRLLLLDEPTSGLDPAGTRAVSALLRELSGQGVAVILSSHLIGELEALCHSYTIIRAGRIVWAGSAASWRRRPPVRSTCSAPVTTSGRWRWPRVDPGSPRASSRAGRNPGRRAVHRP